MSNWNVRLSVVELVKADSAGLALHDLRTRLRAAGFEPYEDDNFEVFESEES